jgi:hypothetical protein
MYNPIESSPNDQIQPKLFVSINSTDIYISSDKFVLNRSISMEVRFNTFPLWWWYDSILKEFLIIFGYRAPPRHVQKWARPRHILIYSILLLYTANEEVGNFHALSHQFPPGIPLFLNFPTLFLSHHFTQQKTVISRISVGNFRYMLFFQVLSFPISNVLRNHLLREVGGKFHSNFLCSLSHLLTKIS